MASISTRSVDFEWDLLDGSGASDWELLSNTRWDDDARSEATDASDTLSLCTVTGWPALSRGDQLDLSSLNYKDALLQGGGGLEGDKASEMAKGPKILVPRHFVNGYRKTKPLMAIEEEMDADEEWWLRKGQGSLLARRRWKFDRRPVFCSQERRQGFQRQQPTWEYECGQSAEGYCAPDFDDEDEL